MADVNLFSDDVVIILGAGASVPFGLPTGLELIDLVRDRLLIEADQFNRLRELSNQHLRQFSIHDVVKVAPIFCAVRDIIGNKITSHSVVFSEAEDELRSLSKWIDSQVSDSIDDLIRHNPLNAQLLKMCIAFEILIRTHDSNGESFVLKDFTKRTIKQFDCRGNPKIDPQTKSHIEIRNWIHNFINLSRSHFLENWGCLSKWQEAEHQEKIKIISFNYDNNLERVLSNTWNSVESGLPEAGSVFEIIHPHGKIESFDLLAKDEIPRWLKDNSDKISVIHDDDTKVNAYVKAERIRAREIISLAHDIFSIGFSFAKLNCHLLGLHNWYNQHLERKIHYINFDNSYSLDKRIEKYCKYHRNRSAVIGTIVPIAEKPINAPTLQITDALMGGFLGEMPS